MIKNLLLNNNKLEKLDKSFLDNLQELESLKINRNRLNYKLKTLELNKNNLSNIDGLTFKHLAKLKVLKLKRNGLASLQDGAFFGLENVTALHLDQNRLSKVRKGWLFGLKKMESLTLSQNDIVEIHEDAWSEVPSLKTLDLSFNKLETIRKETFEKLNSIMNLYLENNSISFLEDQALINLKALEVLELKNNAISWSIEDTNGAFVGLDKLRRLGLHANKIYSIARRAFVGLSSLTDLDLSNNPITSVQENVFEVVPQLRYLSFNTTNLLCDCELGWLPNWLIQTGFQYVINAQCNYPVSLKMKSIFSLSPSDFTCDDHPKTYITQQPNSQVTLKGDNVSLICKAESSSNSPVNYKWRKDYMLLPNASVINFAKAKEGDITEYTTILKLSTIQYKDEGIYQCIFSNHFGSTYSKKATINVHVFPKFTKAPNDMTIKAGTTLTLVCAATGSPAPQIAWKKDGGNDFPAARERRMHVLPQDDRFFIVNVQSIDAGEYSCTASNIVGSIVTNSTITVLEIPSFVKPMEDEETKVSETTVLECMASGSPKPDLIWRKDGEIIGSNERRFFSAGNQLLIIVETQLEDAGTYTCEMSNTLGNHKGSAMLTVIPLNPLSDETSGGKTVIGIVIIVVVCCVVGTSIIWVFIIYHSKKRQIDYNSASTNDDSTEESPFPAPYHPVPAAFCGTGEDYKTNPMYLDSNSENSGSIIPVDDMPANTVIPGLFNCFSIMFVVFCASCFGPARSLSIYHRSCFIKFISYLITCKPLLIKHKQMRQFIESRRKLIYKDSGTCSGKRSNDDLVAIEVNKEPYDRHGSNANICDKQLAEQLQPVSWSLRTRSADELMNSDFSSAQISAAKLSHEPENSVYLPKHPHHFSTFPRNIVGHNSNQVTKLNNENPHRLSQPCRDYSCFKLTTTVKCVSLFLEVQNDSGTSFSTDDEENVHSSYKDYINHVQEERSLSSSLSSCDKQSSQISSTKNEIIPCTVLPYNLENIKDYNVSAPFIYKSDVMDAARDVMDAVRDVIPVACFTTLGFTTLPEPVTHGDEDDELDLFIAMVSSSIIIKFDVRNFLSLFQVQNVEEIILNCLFNGTCCTMDLTSRNIRTRLHLNEIFQKEVHAGFREKILRPLDRTLMEKLKELTDRLKHDPGYACKAGQLETNRRKNRYKDILPYDRTRVVLQENNSDPDSDYINASYVKGSSGSMAYIAAQGPLPQTVNDFWRMVWQCEVQVVVMACNEREGGKAKCDYYWPAVGEKKIYYDIAIQTVRSNNCNKIYIIATLKSNHFFQINVKVKPVCEDFLVRTWKLVRGNEQRTVCQFHYMTWPDHGIPSSVNPILHMIRMIRNCQATETIPVLVHCSAGCGRTGTFCAIDQVWGLLRSGVSPKSYFLMLINLLSSFWNFSQVTCQVQCFVVVDGFIAACTWFNLVIARSSELCATCFQFDNLLSSDHSLIHFVSDLTCPRKLLSMFSLYKMVAEMRYQRVAMVQTKEQYMLVHRAVATLFQQQLCIIDSHPYQNINRLGQPIGPVVDDHIYENVDSLQSDEKSKDSLLIWCGTTFSLNNGSNYINPEWCLMEYLTILQAPSDMLREDIYFVLIVVKIFTDEHFETAIVKPPAHRPPRLETPPSSETETDQSSEEFEAYQARYRQVVPNLTETKQQRSVTLLPRCADSTENPTLPSKRRSQTLVTLQEEENIKKLLSDLNNASDNGPSTYKPRYNRTGSQDDINVTYSPERSFVYISDSDDSDSDMNYKHEVARKPSIAKLKALFEKTDFKIDLLSPSPSPTRREITRSHSQRVTRSNATCFGGQSFNIPVMKSDSFNVFDRKEVKKPILHPKGVCLNVSGRVPMNSNSNMVSLSNGRSNLSSIENKTPNEQNLDEQNVPEKPRLPIKQRKILKPRAPEPNARFYTDNEIVHVASDNVEPTFRRSRNRSNEFTSTGTRKPPVLPRKKYIGGRATAVSPSCSPDDKSYKIVDPSVDNNVKNAIQNLNEICATSEVDINCHDCSNDDSKSMIEAEAERFHGSGGSVFYGSCDLTVSDSSKTKASKSPTEEKFEIPVKSSYTNVSPHAKQNIEQIESSIDQCPRGAIIDLTSTKTVDQNYVAQQLPENIVESKSTDSESGSQSVSFDVILPPKKPNNGYEPIWLGPGQKLLTTSFNATCDKKEQKASLIRENNYGKISPRCRSEDKLLECANQSLSDILSGAGYGRIVFKSSSEPPISVSLLNANAIDNDSTTQTSDSLNSSDSSGDLSKLHKNYNPATPNLLIHSPLTLRKAQSDAVSSNLIRKPTEMGHANKINCSKSSGAAEPEFNSAVAEIRNLIDELMFDSSGSMVKEQPRRERCHSLDILCDDVSGQADIRERRPSTDLLDVNKQCIDIERNVSKTDDSTITKPAPADNSMPKQTVHNIPPVSLLLNPVMHYNSVSDSSDMEKFCSSNSSCLSTGNNLQCSSVYYSAEDGSDVQKKKVNKPGNESTWTPSNWSEQIVEPPSDADYKALSSTVLRNNSAINQRIYDNPSDLLQPEVPPHGSKKSRTNITRSVSARETNRPRVVKRHTERSTASDRIASMATMRPHHISSTPSAKSKHSHQVVAESNCELGKDDGYVTLAETASTFMNNRNQLKVIDSRLGVSTEPQDIPPKSPVQQNESHLYASIQNYPDSNQNNRTEHLIYRTLPQPPPPPPEHPPPPVKILPNEHIYSLPTLPKYRPPPPPPQQKNPDLPTPPPSSEETSSSSSQSDTRPEPLYSQIQKPKREPSHFKLSENFISTGYGHIQSKTSQFSHDDLDVHNKPVAPPRKGRKQHKYARHSLLDLESQKLTWNEG
ncbi:Leucine-rich repeats and immunoglobulin-like domains protein 3 [Nymphon striatum]|nr:Leucine-rich repeats and immunoglobulin-like domains protein 3 [Nymphon striatum]